MEDAATVSVEYTHAAPAKITGIVSDALVNGSLEVTVSLDVTEPGRFNIDARVFAADGKDLGTIPIGIAPQSVGFAGPNKKTLYIVGRGALYKTQTEMISQGIQTRAK